jgi:hypothetical protein
MKKNLKKNMFKFGWLFIAALAIFSACEKDDDDDDPGVPAEDGVYLTGPATGFDGLVLDGMMQPGREEGEGFSSNLRTGMYEKFLYLTAGNFNIVEKSGETEMTYGFVEGTSDTFDNEGEGDETDGPVTTGEVVDGGVAFSAPSAGFYHVIMDKTAGKVWFTQITQWAVIGDATDLGWSDEYAMTEVSLGAESAEWEITDLTLRERGGFKFRYNSGWKISTDDVIIFANIGKGDTDDEFIMGGGTFPYPDAGEGAYTVTLSWTIEDGFSYSTERTGDVEPLPEYPEELYMIGASVGGWDWATVDLPMIPVHSKPHLFWKIVWIEAGVADAGYKFAPQKEWNGDFGYDGEEPVDGIFKMGGTNMPDPDVSGYYMVVVNFETDEIAVVDPKVYLIGDAIGSWDTADSEGLFLVDNENEVITLTKMLSATNELRMYAWFDAAEGWFTDWWQSEFMVLEGEIEFRGAGDDQPRVAVTDSQYTIELNFRTGAGSIIQE